MKLRHRVLEDLAREHGWARGAELGLADGRTSGYLLRTLPGLSMFGVDLFSPEACEETRAWDHCANLEAVKELCREFGERFRFFIHRTDAAANLFPDGHFDFVFIDADHSYTAVLADIQAWLPKVRRGGYLTGHDVNRMPVLLAVRHALGKAEFFDDAVWAWRKP